MKIPSVFKTVFLVIVGFTLMSFLGVGSLAFFADKTTAESAFAKQFMSACTFGWQAGLGAILGLIGGKVTES